MKDESMVSGVEESFYDNWGGEGKEILDEKGQCSE